MLKRILLLLGETPSSMSARRYALHLARETGAELTALAGVDLTFIETHEPVPLGAMAFKLHREQELKHQADDARRRLHDSFADECKDENVPFGWLAFDGDPLTSLYLAAETRDLVIAGHDTAFHGKLREVLPEMLARLIMASPRPTILCPDKPTAGRDILIAYDGSLPSMRAVQIFALLGVAAGSRIVVTAVDADRELAARKANAAARYLESHDRNVVTNPVTSRAAPEEVIRAEVATRDIGTIVMGAYGHKGWREIFFGSTTRSLVEDPPAALFIYH